MTADPADPSDSSRRERWQRRWLERDYADAAVIDVLADHAHLLPETGTALDLACGLGSNALFLAERGLDAHGWDYAASAVGRLRDEAARRGLPVTAEERDVTGAPLPRAAFDVIVVSRFLDRDLCPAIAAALRPGGLLFYQSFVRERATGRRPDDQLFRLAPGELLALFPALRPLVYRDEGRCGDLAAGFRDEAMLVARRDRPGEADTDG